MAKEKDNKTEGAKPAESTMLVGQQKMTATTFILQYNAVILLVLLIIISSFMSKYFFTFTNLVNVFRQQATYLVIAMGLMVCMTAGGIDLSLATTTGLACILITEFNMNQNFGIVTSLVLSLLICALVGAVNGGLVAYLGMPPFIVTLSMSFCLTGVVYLITRGVNLQMTGIGRSVTGALKVFIDFGQENDPILHLPWKIYLAFLIILVTWFIMKYTAFGRLMTATGSNPIAARLAGIDIRKYRLAGHIIASFTAGIGGIVITASTGASAPATINGDYTMIAIAATIIGGSDLMGGRGSVPFSVVGIFVMGLINNIMNLSNIPAYPQYIVKAIVIVLAIFLRSVVDARK